MEKMEFKSINEMEFALTNSGDEQLKVATVEDGTIQPRTMIQPRDIEPRDNENYYSNNIINTIIQSSEISTENSISMTAREVMSNLVLAGVMVLLSIIVWAVCLVSLILNCMRKNTGMAIFSGLGLVLPVVGIIISAVTGGMAWMVVSIIVDLVFLIGGFIFCFSKKKDNK